MVKGCEFITAMDVAIALDQMPTVTGAYGSVSYTLSKKIADVFENINLNGEHV
jgi:hypothetical protein